MTSEYKVKFHVPENSKSVYASSVWGGFSPKGMFELNFIWDRPPFPKQSVDQVDENGNVIKADADRGGYDVERIVQSTVVMDYESVKSLSVWLNKKIEEFELLAQAGKD